MSEMCEKKKACCPKCGAAADITYPSGSVLYKCGTQVSMNGVIYQVYPCTIRSLQAENERLRAELESINQAIANSILAGKTYEGEATGVSLVDRLRGIYTVPVNDGAGLLNGKDTFTSRFAVGQIQHDAANEIERLKKLLGKSRKLLAYHGCAGLVDQIDTALNPKVTT